MRARVSIIRQAVSKESLFQVLTEWCRDGAGRRTWSLRILSAFVSGAAIRALSPLLDVFLADGNAIEIIFGVDRGGTNREALRRLHDFRRSYSSQATVQLFHAPSSQSIFHPKLYMLDTGKVLRVVIGSSNLTIPGLSTNLESLLLYESVHRDSSLGRAFMDMWQIFATPRHPLKSAFLQDLDDRVLGKYIETLPQTHPEERGISRNTHDVWKPLSGAPLPRSITGPTKSSISRRLGAYLVMDVLKETRRTQMQIPLRIVEDFFRIPRREERAVNVSVLTEHGLTHPIVRSVVRSGSAAKSRMMRRLEMPQIKDLARPLAVIFLRLQGLDNFAFLLVERSSPHFRQADELLRDYGQQGRKARRFVIGDVDDPHWTMVRTLLPGQWRGGAR